MRVAGKPKLLNPRAFIGFQFNVAVAKAALEYTSMGSGAQVISAIFRFAL